MSNFSKLQITSLDKKPIIIMPDLLNSIDSWEGGACQDAYGDSEYYDTYEGQVLIDGTQYRIYRHWSNDSLPLGIYDENKGHIGNIRTNDAMEIVIEWNEKYEN